MERSATPSAPARYSAAAMALHWAIAMLLVFQLGLGWRLEELPRGVAQFTGFQLHKSIGILILLLSLGRLALRLVKPRPAPVEDSAPAMLLARTVHILFYVVMIGAPLAGWVLVSTGKVRLQTMLFGLAPWPNLPLPAALHQPAAAVHSLLAFLLAGLIALHVIGAFRHQRTMKGYLGRMLPGPVSGVAITLAALAAAYAAAVFWPFGGSAAPAQVATGSARQAPRDLATPADASVIPAAAPSPSQSAGATPGAGADTLPAAAWKLLPGGKLRFAAAYSGAPVSGSFARWDADILFSPDDLAHSRIRVTVDLASVGTQDSSRDDMLRSDSFFDTAAHPRATFTASRIAAKGGGRYVALGTLSLHGEERPLTLPFALRISGDTASASGSARINRLAYGVGSGEWATTDPIADAVTIGFTLKARRKP